MMQFLIIWSFCWRILAFCLPSLFDHATHSSEQLHKVVENVIKFRMRYEGIDWILLLKSIKYCDRYMRLTFILLVENILQQNSAQFKLERCISWFKRIPLQNSKFLKWEKSWIGDFLAEQWISILYCFVHRCSLPRCETFFYWAKLIVL